MKSNNSSVAAPNRWRRAPWRMCRLAACALVLAAASLAQRSAKAPAPEETAGGAPPAAEAENQEPGAPAREGSLTVDSAALSPDVIGYGGPVPVIVRVDDGLVASVEPKLPNDETPMFFDLLEEEGLWNAWNGLPPDVAATTRVDAVASATYSSSAAIANARAAFAAAAASLASGEGGAAALPPAAPPAAAQGGRTPVRPLATLVVLLLAATVPLVSNSRRLRTVQLGLDVAVLGVWSGTFLSTARLLGWARSGLPRAPAEQAAAALLLATAFLWPALFGRRSHYCLNVCPFGAAQQLAARLPTPKWTPPPMLLRALSIFRIALWIALMALLVCGLSSRWLGWELFGAFAWRAAPPLVLAFAALFVALSAFVPRPYCRFVCPTGVLLGIAG